MTDYLRLNRAMWDERAAKHAVSPDYEVERFIRDSNHLSKVVQFDLPRLGDISGRRSVHLQCHIGTDALSLARLGAKISGLDFSPASLEQARQLAKRTHATIDYHEAELYDAVEVLGAGVFELVYTGIGALWWLPDVARWAQVVAGLLCRGGRLFIRDIHPMLASLDDEAAQPMLRYSYYQHAAPFISESTTSYVYTEGKFTNTTNHGWNHGLGEIVTAVLDAGLRLTQLIEHDSTPANALPGQMVCDDTGEWRLATNPERLAATFTMQAIKP